MDTGRLVVACQPPLIVLALVRVVQFDVTSMLFTQFLDGNFDRSEKINKQIM